MDDRDWMLSRFEEERPRLRGVAYRMLGSASDADDALQDAWLRLQRADAAVVEKPPAWLTTVVARVCLNMLRSRQARREDSFDASTIDRVAVEDSGPEEEALLADSVGLALLVVLDMLTPAERLAFVLHDMFDLSFGEIASILGRSSSATRQLASRARRRVKGVDPAPHADVARQHRVVDAYLAATRDGDFEGLVTLLDPDVVLRADAAAVPSGEPAVLRGVDAVVAGALASSARARFAAPALVNGTVGLVMAPRGRLLLVLAFAIERDRITGIDVIADPDRLRRLELAVLE